MVPYFSLMVNFQSTILIHINYLKLSKESRGSYQFLIRFKDKNSLKSKLPIWYFLSCKTENYRWYKNSVNTI